MGRPRAVVVVRVVCNLLTAALVVVVVVVAFSLLTPKVAKGTESKASVVRGVVRWLLCDSCLHMKKKKKKTWCFLGEAEEEEREKRKKDKKRHRERKRERFMTDCRGLVSRSD